MRKSKAAVAVLLLVAAIPLTGLFSSASADHRKGFTTRLVGYQEVPFVSTHATGHFRAGLDYESDTIRYRLSYRNLSSEAHQAHIHLGQRHTNGGVAAFLCGGGDKPACPESGVVTGTIDAADVIDVTSPADTSQGIAAGEIGELMRAVRHNATYANVHTADFPSGEIRGQIHRPRHE